MNTVWPQPPTLTDMAFVSVLAPWVQHGSAGVADTCLHSQPSVASFGTEAGLWRSTLYADGCVDSHMHSRQAVLGILTSHDAYPEGYVE